MRSRYRKFLDDLNSNLESYFRKTNNRKKAKKRLKKMEGGFDCDKDYESTIVPYWEQFNYKPEKYWYNIFLDKKDKIDPKYIPDDLYYGDLVPYFSNQQFRRFGEDKCYHYLWFSEFNRPKTICKNIAGVYYDSEMNIITKLDAINLCTNYKDEIIIKPSIDSGEGRLIEFIDGKRKNVYVIKECFDKIGANFIVQEVIKQNEMLSEFNSSSLNTIRVISFLFDNKVHILSAIFRVGAKGERVDNVGAGGFACPIKEDGTLSDRAVNRNAKWVEETKDGVTFKGKKLPAYDEIIDMIKEKHKHLAHFKLIGWDFSVDQDGNPIFIEFNTCPGANQITCGPTFGEITDSVLEEFFVKRSLEKSQN